MKNIQRPDAARGQKLTVTLADNPEPAATLAHFGDKRDVANLAGMRSVRWVDNMLAQGMPHLRLGPRRVRFDLPEVREWLRSRFGTKRRALAHPQASATK